MKSSCFVAQNKFDVLMIYAVSQKNSRPRDDYENFAMKIRRLINVTSHTLNLIALLFLREITKHFVISNKYNVCHQKCKGCGVI